VATGATAAAIRYRLPLVKLRLLLLMLQKLLGDA
jgi:hypothetical protein